MNEVREYDLIYSVSLDIERSCRRQVKALVPLSLIPLSTLMNKFFLYSSKRLAVCPWIYKFSLKLKQD